MAQNNAPAPNVLRETFPTLAPGKTVIKRLRVTITHRQTNTSYSGEAFIRVRRYVELSDAKILLSDPNNPRVADGEAVDAQKVVSLTAEPVEGLGEYEYYWSIEVDQQPCGEKVKCYSLLSWNEVTQKHDDITNEISVLGDLVKETAGAKNLLVRFAEPVEEIKRYEVKIRLTIYDTESNRDPQKRMPRADQPHIDHEATLIIDPSKLQIKIIGTAKHSQFDGASPENLRTFDFPTKLNLKAAVVAGGKPTSRYQYSWASTINVSENNPRQPAVSHDSFAVAFAKRKSLNDDTTKGGKHSVTVVVTDTLTGKTGTQKIEFKAVNLRAEISDVKTARLTPLTKIFAAFIGNGQPPYQYEWTFDPATGAKQRDTLANDGTLLEIHNYPKAGKYDVTLKVTDANNVEIVEARGVVVKLGELLLTEQPISILRGIGSATESAFEKLSPAVKTLAQLAVIDPTTAVGTQSTGKIKTFHDNAAQALNIDFSVVKEFTKLSDQTLQQLVTTEVNDLAKRAGVSAAVANELLDRLRDLKVLLTAAAFTKLELGALGVASDSHQ